MIGQPATRPRLLLHLSSASDAEAAVDVAVNLARALHRDLVAQFIEDDDLLTACALPLRNLVGFRGEVLEDDTPAVQSRMQLEARRCHAVVRQRAESAHLAWTFSATRSRIQSSIEGRVGKSDILVIRADAIAARWRDVIRLAAAMAPAEGGVLILPAHTRVAAIDRAWRIAVLDSQGSGSERISAVAEEIGMATGATVVQLNTADTGISTRSDPVHFVVGPAAPLRDADPEFLNPIERLRVPLLLLS